MSDTVINVKQAAWARLEDVLNDVIKRSKQNVMSDESDGFSLTLAYTANDMDGVMVILGGVANNQPKCLQHLIERMGRSNATGAKFAVLSAISNLAEDVDPHDCTKILSYDTRKKYEKK